MIECLCPVVSEKFESTYALTGNSRRADDDRLCEISRKTFPSSRLITYETGVQ